MEKMIDTDTILNVCPHMTKNNLFRQIRNIITHKDGYVGVITEDTTKDSITGRTRKVYYINEVAFKGELMKSIKNKIIKFELQTLYYDVFKTVDKAEEVELYLMNWDLQKKELERQIKSLKGDIKDLYSERNKASQFAYHEEIEEPEEETEECTEDFNFDYVSHYDYSDDDNDEDEEDWL